MYPFENRCESCGNDCIALVKVLINAGRDPNSFDVGLKEKKICFKCLIEYDKLDDE